MTAEKMFAIGRFFAALGMTSSILFFVLDLHLHKYGWAGVQFLCFFLNVYAYKLNNRRNS